MSTENPFDSSGGNLSGFAKGLIPITPSDSVYLASVLIGITCKGAAGDISIVTAKNQTVIYPIALGEVLPVGTKRVNATGTTAAGLWGFEA